MTTLRAVRVAVVISAVLLASCSAHHAPTPGDISTTTTEAARDCGSVAFTATASSQGAFRITARGTDCETARAVATAAKGHNGERYSFQGFTCPPGSASPSNGIAFFAYQCVNAAAQVTFDEQG